MASSDFDPLVESGRKQRSRKRKDSVRGAAAGLLAAVWKQHIGTATTIAKTVSHREYIESVEGFIAERFPEFIDAIEHFRDLRDTRKTTAQRRREAIAFVSDFSKRPFDG